MQTLNIQNINDFNYIVQWLGMQNDTLCMYLCFIFAQEFIFEVLPSILNSHYHLFILPKFTSNYIEEHII